MQIAGVIAPYRDACIAYVHALSEPFAVDHDDAGGLRLGLIRARGQEGTLSGVGVARIHMEEGGGLWESSPKS